MGRHAKDTYTTDLQLKRLKTPGFYNVAPGLFLRVATPEAKAWVFRFMLDGKAHAMGLGSFPSEMSLERAREHADAYRKLRKQGINPIEQRKAQEAQERANAAKRMTFRQAAEGFIADHRDGWKNAKHASQWTNTLQAYAFPTIGGLPVQDVSTEHVLSILRPIWKEKPETANRVRGRIESILDWATAHKAREGDNPARWRGNLKHVFPSRKKLRVVKHHPALPYAELPAFMAQLADQGGLSSEALRYTILTAARTNEVIGMAWAEVSFDDAIWTVPPERMKGTKDKPREHRVPLSKPALAILRKRQEMTGGQGFVFPGNGKSRHLSNMAMLKALARLGRDDITVHGFRSTFRDWCEERTSFAGTVAEAALAHAVGDQTEAAYRRGDLFEKRRRLMTAWGSYCTTPAEQRGKVIDMRKST